MQCHEFEAELQEGLDARQPLRLTAPAEQHRASCTHCARFASGLIALSKRLADCEVAAASPASRAAGPGLFAWAGAALAASLCGVLLWSARRPTPDVPRLTQSAPLAPLQESVRESPLWRPHLMNGLALPALPGSLRPAIELPRERLVGMATFGIQPLSSTVGAAVQALRHVIAGDGEPLAPPMFFSPTEPADSAAWHGYTDWVA